MCTHRHRHTPMYTHTYTRVYKHKINKNQCIITNQWPLWLETLPQPAVQQATAIAKATVQCIVTDFNIMIMIRFKNMDTNKTQLYIFNGNMDDAMTLNQ